MSTTPAFEELTAVDQDLLARAQRMLVGLADPGVARRAEAAGYDAEEHEAGWRAFEVASGRQRPFGVLLQVATASDTAEAPGLAARYGALDAFENKWFPRARMAIRRFVANEVRDRVEAAFFAELAQQPLGPGVVGSVARFLERLEGLAASDAPGAAEAVASLQKKGLDAAEVARMQGLLAEARALGPSAPPPAELAGQVEAMNAERRAALDTLRRWLNDWSLVFRDELPHNDRQRLGLSRKGGRPRKVVEEVEAEVV
ncbi:MAG: hypothetical protein H6706_00090 [Myxococcales bacterium]|nr:hypothetical protein [Myxococcales bacterium]